MNYKKIIESKKNLDKITGSIKTFADTNSQKLSEVLTETTNTIKENFKAKLDDEFKRNYPIFALNYVNTQLIKKITEGKELVVSDEVTVDEDVLTISKIVEEMGKDVIDSKSLFKYTSDEYRIIIFSYLYLYLSTEEQLSVEKVNEKTFKVSFKEDIKEETEE